MNLFKLFENHFKQNFSILFNKDVKCIVAVSGGIDSTVLVDLLYKLEIDFSIAHCNFNLRGDESKRDESFVESLAHKYNKQFLVTHFDTKKYAEENKISIQIAARELRYNWFKELQTVNSKTQHYLVTAHHKNDNIETVLFNFFRGTGIVGLTGIKEIDNERKIIRPLLPFSKDDIKLYAKKENLTFVEDSSNSSNKYTRNSFRNEIIPLVTKHFEQAEENIYNNILRLNEVQKLYEKAISLHKENLLEVKENEVHIPIIKLKKTEQIFTIIYEISKDYNFTSAQTSEVLKLLDAHNGSYIQSTTHRIIKNRNWLIITPIASTISQNMIIEKNNRVVEFDNGKLLFSVDDFSTEQETKNIKQNIKSESLDFDKLEFPLILRKWKQGDYFYPLGLGKKQKLSKFFINQKLSIAQKEKVWVIESNKKIVCVVSHRIDDRFKLTNITKKIFKISIENKA